MKKMMTSFLLISLILVTILSVPVSAATKPSTSTTVSRPERLERRQAVLDLRIAMLQKQLSCLQMARDNNALRIELRGLLSENRETLTPEAIEALKASNQVIRNLADQLRETRGDIRDLLDELHDGTPPTLEDIESTYDQIADILDLRLTLLGQINDTLSDMIEQVEG